MKKLKELWLKLFPAKKKETRVDEDLVTILEATWCQKQLDDLLLMNQSVMMSLKTDRFNPKYLEKRDKIHHDIDKMQAIVLLTGTKVSALIEKKYGVEFYVLSGRPLKKPVEQAAGKSIVLPGQENK